MELLSIESQEENDALLSAIGLFFFSGGDLKVL